MRAVRRQWLIPFLLGGFCLVLAGLLVMMLRSEPGVMSSGQTVATVEFEAEVPPAAPQSRVEALESYVHALTRPPMLPSRRLPAEWAEGVAPGGGTVSTAFVLRGVVVNSGRRLALLQRADGTMVRVHDGENIDGWTVDAITRVGVVVRRGSVRQELTLTDTGRRNDTGSSAQPRARQRP